MKVLIDGKEIEVKNDIRVIWDVPLSDGEGHIQMVANHEGIVWDLYDAEGVESLATEYEMAVDKAAEMEDE